MSDLRPLHPRLAAELLGIRPDLQVDDATFAAIEAVWLRYPVLVFRNIAAPPVQQIAFSRRLGPLHVRQPHYNLAGHPEIFVVSNAEEGGTQVGMRRVGLAGTPTARTSAPPMLRRSSMPCSCGPRAVSRYSAPCTPPTTPCPPKSAHASRAGARASRRVSGMGEFAFKGADGGDGAGRRIST